MVYGYWGTVQLQLEIRPWWIAGGEVEDWYFRVCIIIWFSFRALLLLLLLWLWVVLRHDGFVWLSF